MLFSRRHLGSLTQPALSALFLVSFVYCVRHLDIQCSSAVATLVPLLNQHCLPCLRVSFVYCVRHLIFSALQPSPPWFPYSTSIVCLVKGQLCVLCQAPDIQCSSAVATLVPLLNQHCLPCLSQLGATVSGT